jgi:hypothetical protein
MKEQETEFQKKVLKLHYKKNWYFALSFSKTDETVRKNISLIVLCDDYYIELIPGYGPVTIIRKSTNEKDENRKDDYIFDYSQGRSEWSQSYFEKNKFNDLLSNYKYDICFQLLEQLI